MMFNNIPTGFIEPKKYIDKPIVLINESVLILNKVIIMFLLLKYFEVSNIKYVVVNDKIKLKLYIMYGLEKTNRLKVIYNRFVSVMFRLYSLLKLINVKNMVALKMEGLNPDMKEKRYNKLHVNM